MPLEGALSPGNGNKASVCEALSGEARRALPGEGALSPGNGVLSPNYSVMRTRPLSFSSL